MTWICQLCSMTNTSEKYERTQQGNLLHDHASKIYALYTTEINCPEFLGFSGQSIIEPPSSSHKNFFSPLRRDILQVRGLHGSFGIESPMDFVYELYIRSVIFEPN